jgi:DNA-directed RNA polymerase specialized sigma24 family protein
MAVGTSWQRLARMHGSFNEHSKTKHPLSEFDPNELQLLIKSAQAGDSKAFQMLVMTFDAAILQTGLRITGSPRLAAELYRRTFLRAYHKLATFHFDYSFSVWIFRQLAQLCMEHLRQESVQGNSRDDRCTAGVLSQLTPLERMIVELNFGQGFSLSLVSEILEMPRDVVRLSFLCAKGKIRTARGAELSCLAERPFLEEVT